MTQKRLMILSALLFAIFLFVIQNQREQSFIWLFFEFPMPGFLWVFVLVGLGFALGFLTAYFYLVRPKGKEPTSSGKDDSKPKEGAPTLSRDYD